MSLPEALVGEASASHALGLRVAGVELEVATNDADVWAALRRYYAPWVATVTAPEASIRLIQGQPDVRGRFTDLVRADGKPVKEAVQDVAGGRLILKRATAVVMGLGAGHAFAVGDLRANLNQAINLVNACYAKRVLGRGYVLLHAAGVSRDGRAVVLAGPPGAGKSSAALHLVDAGFRFLSNDRVLSRADAGACRRSGIPSSRASIGHVGRHPRLRAAKAESARRSMPWSPALWALERKRDGSRCHLRSRPVELQRRCRRCALALATRRDGLRLDRLAPDAGSSAWDLPQGSRRLRSGPRPRRPPSCGARCYRALIATCPCSRSRVGSTFARSSCRRRHAGRLTGRPRWGRRGTFTAPSSSRNPPDRHSPAMKTSSPTLALGRVLVVEDERDVAELIRYNLGKEGYDVVVTASGTDAVKQARESRPDIVLLDIMVPHLNGWEVCRRLKQDAETRNIPVIMVTGRAEEGDKVLGFEMGADDYVTKPFSPRELLARVRAVVRRGRGDGGERKTHLRVGDLEIDRHRSMSGSRARGRLTPKEFELLAILASAPGALRA